GYILKAVKNNLGALYQAGLPPKVAKQLKRAIPFLESAIIAYQKNEKPEFNLSLFATNSLFVSAIITIEKEKKCLLNERLKEEVKVERVVVSQSSIWVRRQLYGSVRSGRPAVLRYRLFKYSTFHQALRALDHQVDSEREERDWLLECLRVLEGLINLKEEDSALLKQEIKKILARLNNIRIEDKRMARIILRAALELLEIQRLKQIAELLDFARDFFSLRVKETEQIINRLSLARNKILLPYVEKGNSYLLDKVIKILRSLKYTSVLAQKILREDFLNQEHRAHAYLREPGLNIFFRVFDKINNTREFPFVAEQVFKLMRDKVVDAALSTEFIQYYRSLYVKARMENSLGIKSRQGAFNKAFLEFYQSSNSVRGSPRLYWSIFYQVAFVPTHQRTKPPKDNPLFSDLSNYITHRQIERGNYKAIVRLFPQEEYWFSEAEQAVFTLATQIPEEVSCRLGDIFRTTSEPSPELQFSPIALLAGIGIWGGITGNIVLGILGILGLVVAIILVKSRLIGDTSRTDSEPSLVLLRGKKDPFSLEFIGKAIDELEQFTKTKKLKQYVGKGVSVFGSAREVFEESYYKSIAGMTSGFRCFTITGGGGSVMAAANRGAKKGNHKSIGLLIKLLKSEPPNAFLDIKLWFRYFFSRKMTFIILSKAFVVCKGGFGTLDELFEVLALLDRNIINKPVYILGGKFYSQLMLLINDMEKRGFTRRPPEELKRLVQLCVSVKQVTRKVNSLLASEQEIRLDRETIRRGFEDTLRKLEGADSAIAIVGSGTAIEDPYLGQQVVEISRHYAPKGVPFIVRSGWRFGGKVAEGISEAAVKAPEGARLSKIINLKTNTQSTHIQTDIVVEYSYMFQQKVALTQYSSAYIFLPGGFNTLDLLFNILTLIQTGKIEQRPIVLIGREFWEPWHRFFTETLLKNHVISEKDILLYKIVDNAQEAIEVIEDFYKNGLIKSFRKTKSDFRGLIKRSISLKNTFALLAFLAGLLVFFPQIGAFLGDLVGQVVSWLSYYFFESFLGIVSYAVIPGLPTGISFDERGVIVRAYRPQDVLRPLLSSGSAEVITCEGAKIRFTFEEISKKGYRIKAFDHDEQIGYCDFSKNEIYIGHHQAWAIKVFNSPPRGVGRGMVSLALAFSQSQGLESFGGSAVCNCSFWYDIGFIPDGRVSLLSFFFAKKQIPDIQISREGQHRFLRQAVIFEEVVPLGYTKQKKRSLYGLETISRDYPGSRLVISEEGLNEIIRLESVYPGEILYHKSRLYMDDGQFIADEEFQKEIKHAQLIHQYYPQSFYFLQRIVYPFAPDGQKGRQMLGVRVMVMREAKEVKYWIVEEKQTDPGFIKLFIDVFSEYRREENWEFSGSTKGFFRKLFGAGKLEIKEMAEELKIPESLFRRWLYGKGTPQDIKLKGIAEYLDLSEEVKDDLLLLAHLERMRKKGRLSHLPPGNNGAIGNIKPGHRPFIEEVIRKGDFRELNEFNAYNTAIEGIPVSFYALTSQPTRAPPAFIWARIREGTLEVYFSSEEFAAAFQAAFPRTRRYHKILKRSLEILSYHEYIEIKEGSHHIALQKTRKKYRHRFSRLRGTPFIYIIFDYVLSAEYARNSGRDEIDISERITKAFLMEGRLPVNFPLPNKKRLLKRTLIGFIPFPKNISKITLQLIRDKDSKVTSIIFRAYIVEKGKKIFASQRKWLIDKEGNWRKEESKIDIRHKELAAELGWLREQYILETNPEIDISRIIGEYSLRTARLLNFVTPDGSKLSPSYVGLTSNLNKVTVKVLERDRKSQPTSLCFFGYRDSQKMPVVSKICNKENGSWRFARDPKKIKSKNINDKIKLAYKELKPGENVSWENFGLYYAQGLIRCDIRIGNYILPEELKLFHREGITIGTGEYSYRVSLHIQRTQSGFKLNFYGHKITVFGERIVKEIKTAPWIIYQYQQGTSDYKISFDPLHEFRWKGSTEVNEKPEFTPENVGRVAEAIAEWLLVSQGDKARGQEKVLIFCDSTKPYRSKYFARQAKDILLLNGIRADIRQEIIGYSIDDFIRETGDYFIGVSIYASLRQFQMSEKSPVLLLPPSSRSLRIYPGKISVTPAILEEISRRANHCQWCVFREKSTSEYFELLKVANSYFSDTVRPTQCQGNKNQHLFFDKLLTIKNGAADKNFWEGLRKTEKIALLVIVAESLKKAVRGLIPQDFKEPIDVFGGKDLGGLLAWAVQEYADTEEGQLRESFAVLLLKEDLLGTVLNPKQNCPLPVSPAGDTPASLNILTCNLMTVLLALSFGIEGYWALVLGLGAILTWPLINNNLLRKYFVPNFVNYKKHPQRRLYKRTIQASNTGKSNLLLQSDSKGDTFRTSSEPSLNLELNLEEFLKDNLSDILKQFGKERQRENKKLVFWGKEGFLFYLQKRAEEKFNMKISLGAIGKSLGYSADSVSTAMYRGNLGIQKAKVDAIVREFNLDKQAIEVLRKIGRKFKAKKISIEDVKPHFRALLKEFYFKTEGKGLFQGDEGFVVFFRCRLKEIFGLKEISLNQVGILLGFTHGTLSHSCKNDVSFYGIRHYKIRWLIREYCLVGTEEGYLWEIGAPRYYNPKCDPTELSLDDASFWPFFIEKLKTFKKDGGVCLSGRKRGLLYYIYKKGEFSSGAMALKLGLSPSVLDKVLDENSNISPRAFRVIFISFSRALETMNLLPEERDWCQSFLLSLAEAEGLRIWESLLEYNEDDTVNSKAQRKSSSLPCDLTITLLVLFIGAVEYWSLVLGVGVILARFIINNNLLKKYLKPCFARGSNSNMLNSEASFFDKLESLPTANNSEDSGISLLEGRTSSEEKDEELPPAFINITDESVRGNKIRIVKVVFDPAEYMIRPSLQEGLSGNMYWDGKTAKTYISGKQVEDFCKYIPNIGLHRNNMTPGYQAVIPFGNIFWHLYFVAYYQGKLFCRRGEKANMEQGYQYPSFVFYKNKQRKFRRVAFHETWFND
ncbi:hypothetical protein D4R78_06200, partial [bacterium]